VLPFPVVLLIVLIFVLLFAFGIYCIELVLWTIIVSIIEGLLDPRKRRENREINRKREKLEKQNKESGKC
jgi:uncharacterized membrane protein